MKTFVAEVELYDNEVFYFEFEGSNTRKIVTDILNDEYLVYCSGNSDEAERYIRTKDIKEVSIFLGTLEDIEVPIDVEVIGNRYKRTKWSVYVPTIGVGK